MPRELRVPSPNRNNKQRPRGGIVEGGGLIWVIEGASGAAASSTYLSGFRFKLVHNHIRAVTMLFEIPIHLTIRHIVRTEHSCSSCSASSFFSFTANLCKRDAAWIFKIVHTFIRSVTTSRERYGGGTEFSRAQKPKLTFVTLEVCACTCICACYGVQMRARHARSDTKILM